MEPLIEAQKCSISGTSVSAASSIDKCPVPGSTCMTACGIWESNSACNSSGVPTRSNSPAMTMVGTSTAPTCAVMSSRLVAFGQASFARRRSAQAIRDHLFAVPGRERLGCQHLVDGHLHRFAGGLGARHHLSRVCLHDHGLRRRGGDENEANQPGGPRRRHKLSGFAAHGMVYQHVALQGQRLDHPFCISREIRQPVSVGWCVTLAPAAMVDGNGMEGRCQLGRDALRGPG